MYIVAGRLLSMSMSSAMAAVGVSTKSRKPYICFVEMSVA